VETIRGRILNDQTITELVVLVAEEIDALAGELGGQLQAVESELADERSRLERLYEALETTELTMQALSPRILKLRQREDQLEAAQEDAARQLWQRKANLPTTEEVREYVADFHGLFSTGTIPERKALIRSFVKSIEVDGDMATLTYTVPMPSDGVTKERTPVLDFAQPGPPAVKMRAVVWSCCREKERWPSRCGCCRVGIRRSPRATGMFRCRRTLRRCRAGKVMSGDGWMI
jgi:hypothetical protein